ncbi:MAG: hypothetical protein ACI8PZ_002532 [Myxococcota bacterium]|jgi:hypothetical protein
MSHWWTLPVVLLLVACGGRKTPTPAGDDPAATAPKFVEIDMGDEDEEDFFPELMKATAQCGDLVSLEPSAMMGKLQDAEIRCLDGALRDSDRMTVKDKISRVLMKDAWAKGDEHRWEAVSRRHLEEIDQSDPDLCYKFARFMSARGPEHTDETMRWADVALENRSRWTGDVHVKRVYALFKVKTVAAQKKWEYLEAQYIETPTEQLLSQKDEARNQLKTLAREWLEYARQSGKDSTVPQQMCVSAAGTEGYCDET